MMNDGMAKKRVDANNRISCMERCLNETSFECRSVNYNRETGDCSLFDVDRQGISSGQVVKRGMFMKQKRVDQEINFDQNFLPSHPDPIDYLENNCIKGQWDVPRPHHVSILLSSLFFFTLLYTICSPSLILFSLHTSPLLHFLSLSLSLSLSGCLLNWHHDLRSSIIRIFFLFLFSLSTWSDIEMLLTCLPPSQSLKPSFFFTRWCGKKSLAPSVSEG